MPYDPHDPLRNVKDPLHKAGPSNGRDLFRHLGQICSRYEAPHSAVRDAAFNLILSSVRQEHATFRAAEASFDEQVARVKQVLRDHYDANGKRRNVFPFEQIIAMDHVKVS